MGQVLSAVTRPGQHAVIFGERGVGKTSLAGLIHEFWADLSRSLGLIAPRINCEPLDDFSTLWANVGDEILSRLEQRDTDPPRSFLNTLTQLAAGDATPNLVRRCFQESSEPVVIVIDEFDRLQDDQAISRMADTIKALSDHSVETTLVLVGVADTIDELIEDHASIDRALVQVFVSRLSPNDIQDVVKSRATQVGMQVDSEALRLIAVLSQGLPYYAHLVGLSSGLTAIDVSSRSITVDHVLDGLRVALKNAQESIKGAYAQATNSARKHSIYRQVLLASALTPVDDLGYFSPGDVRPALARITGRQHEIAHFVGHLNQFCDVGRGSVLQRSGQRWRQRYRFRDSLLKPYVIFEGLEEGLLRREDLDERMQAAK